MPKRTGLRSGVLQVRKPRADGWTKTARATFLLHLAATCNVKASCKAAGKNLAGLYRLRARDPGFAREWELALEAGYQRLEAELLRRAMGDDVGDTLDGVETDDGIDGDGDGDGDGSGCGVDAEPAMPFDVELALKLLAQRRTVDPQGRRKSVLLRQPSAEEVLKALDRKLTAMEKRLGDKCLGEKGPGKNRPDGAA